MTGRPLKVTQKQVTAILKGAAAAGVNYEVRIENGVVRFVPCDAPQEPPQLDSKPNWYL
ncbi:hypothetical protein VQ042_11735 [Aurantimonas sp. A2-1-M11]|uniref:hypothetical protein n=1 Tax=Aurantimonas sp. A2-1-M11 TaxID=3113712 RepID=UPI002F9254F1